MPTTDRSRAEREKWIKEAARKGLDVRETSDETVFRINNKVTNLKYSQVDKGRAWFSLGNEYLKRNELFVLICGDHSKFYIIPKKELHDLVKATTRDIHSNRPEFRIYVEKQEYSSGSSNFNIKQFYCNWHLFDSPTEAVIQTRLEIINLDSNSGDLQVTSPHDDVGETLARFREWFNTDTARKHLKNIENEKIEVQALMKRLDSMDESSQEFTDWVLYGLLPYFKTKLARRVSTFPAFMNVKQFFKEYNYTDEDWTKIANIIYTLASKFQRSPDKLDRWIQDFTANLIHSRSFQSGSITPILFCINDSYPLINPRVIRTYNHFSSVFGWNDIMPLKLEKYLDGVQKCKKLISALHVTELRDMAVFDVFCYWYDHIYRKAKTDQSVEETGDENGEVIEMEDVDYPVFLESVKLENISKLEPHSLEKPNTARINQIILNCSNGRWRLPKFQRYFDWKKNDIKDFLASIFNDYYVGSLLLWTTGKEVQLETMPIKGVFDADEHRIESIVLDGQQRITSLYYAIRAPGFPLKGGGNKAVYFYADFKNFFDGGNLEEMIQVLPNKLEAEESYRKMLFPFYDLDNYTKWVDELEEFMKKSAPNSHERIRTMTRMIDRKLKHILYDFEIPYIMLPETMEIDQVTTIFEKINTTGKMLSVFDLLIARLMKYGVELREVWEETLERHSKIAEYYKSIDKMPIYILQAISLCHNPTSSCKRRDILDIYQNVFEAGELSFDETWREMAEFISRAISRLENLRDGYGVKDKTEIPFTPMIPILAALIREIEEKKERADCYRKVNQWYWASVFSNAYSSAVESQLASDFKEMKKWFEADDAVPRTLEKARREIATIRLDEVQTKGNAMYKGVLSLIALKGAQDFESGLALENARNDNDKDHVFPFAAFKSQRNVNSILNMTWMSKETNIRRGAKRPSTYLSEFVRKYKGNEQELRKVLESHLINDATYEFMKRDDLENFMAEREKEIMNEMISRIGVNISNSKPTMISPETPFSNEMIFRDTIAACSDHIYWVDKYFSVKGLRLLNDALDRKKVKDIRILMSNEKADESLRRLFKDFRDEMKAAGITCQLRVMVDPKLKSSIHDRWIISRRKIFNLPSPDIMARGQYSEVKETSNKPPFDNWWEKSVDIFESRIGTQ